MFDFHLLPVFFYCSDLVDVEVRAGGGRGIQCGLFLRSERLRFHFRNLFFTAQRWTALVYTPWISAVECAVKYCPSRLIFTFPR